MQYNLMVFLGIISTLSCVIPSIMAGEIASPNKPINIIKIAVIPTNTTDRIPIVNHDSPISVISIKPITEQFSPIQSIRNGRIRKPVNQQKRKYKKKIATTNDNADPTIDNSKINTIKIIQQKPVQYHFNPPKMLNSEHESSLRIAPGAYPVYYAIARANGKFGKRIQSYRPNHL